MLRKFGSMQAFERFKRSHGLIERGNEVGLDESIGYTEESLGQRIQSSTMRSHRLIAYLSKVSGLLVDRMADVGDCIVIVRVLILFCFYDLFHHGSVNYLCILYMQMYCAAVRL